MKRRLRLGPIENETPFSELQQRYDYLVNKGRLPAIYQQPRQPPKVQSTKPRKGRNYYDGYAPTTIKEILKNDDAGSHANLLLHPNRSLPDPIKGEEDIPKYIYTTRLRKPKDHEVVTNIIDNVNQRRSFARKKSEQRETERKLIDTIVADYLCNNNFGHVIPVYEGTGIKTCSCCTSRNRENVRNVLGLPTERSNAAGVNENPEWNVTRTGKGRNVRYNIYPLGKQQQHEHKILKLDPSFRLSDETARANWAASATFELPDFYKEAIANKNSPRFYQNRDWPEALHKYREAHSEISPNYASNSKLSPRSINESRSVAVSLKEAEDDDNIINKRISSADKKYQLAMNNLRRFRAK